MRDATVVLLMVCLTSVVGRCDDPPRPNTPPDPAPQTQPAKAGDSLTFSDTTPNPIGQVDASFWKPLSAEQQSASVSRLKDFAHWAIERIKHPLYLQETRQMLVYTDLPQTDAGACCTLLERSYARIAETLGVEKNRSVFRGKALVFIFSRVEEYRLYERLCEDTDPGGSFGMTHCFGDGMVHMAFFRYTAEEGFSHLVAHESVHAFLHRYRSPVRIPSWVNEGLADVLADDIVPNPRRAKLVTGLARAGIEAHHRALGDFFSANQIDGWQYPVAEAFCAWLLRLNRREYLDFINGIKDGGDAEKCLKAAFKTSRDKLVSDYGKAIGVRGLK